MTRRATRLLVGPAVFAMGLFAFAPSAWAALSSHYTPPPQHPYHPHHPHHPQHPQHPHHPQHPTPPPHYGPLSVYLTISVSSIGPGGTITITIYGGHAGEVFTLTLSLHAGTVAAVKGTHAAVLDAATVLGTVTVNATGAASTQVTIPATSTPGSYTVTGRGNDGNMSSTALNVGNASHTSASSPLSPTPGSPTPIAPNPRGSGLAFANAGTATCAGAVAVGGILVLGSRRRRRQAWN